MVFNKIVLASQDFTSPTTIESASIHSLLIAILIVIFVESQELQQNQNLFLIHVTVSHTSCALVLIPFHCVVDQVFNLIQKITGVMNRKLSTAQ